MIKTTSTLLLLLALIVGAGCDSTATSPMPTPTPARIDVLSGDVAAVPGYGTTVHVRVFDGAGGAMDGVQVRFQPADAENGRVDPAMAHTSADGSARTVWTLPSTPGSYRLTASVEEDGQATGPEAVAVEVPGTVESFSAAVDAMLLGLGRHIESSLGRMAESLLLNPHLASDIQARMELLERPGLENEILAGRRFFEEAAASTDERAVAVVTVFPAESMRQSGSAIGPAVAAALPVMEGFLDTPFPTDVIRVWYGFRLGSSGGGGTVNLEDRETYEVRAALLPHRAILHHEMAHSYIGNESLTQLVELVVYNGVRTGSTDLGDWVFLRAYPGPRDDNVDIHALLDIYGLIGYDAVARALHAILPLRPPYGQPLCAACVEAFVDQAPAELKDVVRAKAERVSF